MAKKTLILSQEQLTEICGGDFSYLDGLSVKPDMGPVFSKEIGSDGTMDSGYANPTTTDDISKDRPATNWRGNAKLHGMGPITVNEETMSLSEWKKKYVSEEQEHGNARLKNLNFGAKDGEEGKSYGATKTALCRKRAAEKTMQTGGTPEIKAKAANTLANMKNNWDGIDNAETQYNAAKTNDKNIVAMKPEGTKRASAQNSIPKADGGVFLN